MSTAELSKTVAKDTFALDFQWSKVKFRARMRKAHCYILDLIIVAVIIVAL